MAGAVAGESCQLEPADPVPGAAAKVHLADPLQPEDPLAEARPPAHRALSVPDEECSAARAARFPRRMFRRS